MAPAALDKPVVGLPPIHIHQRVAALGAEIRPWSIDQTGIRTLGDKRGDGVTWGFVDTGYSYHPDLDSAILGRKDFTNSRRGADDIHGHGTHTLGTFCGAQRATDDGPGVANAARAYMAKGLGDDGIGSDEITAESIYWLVDGCRVHGVNLSLGSPAFMPMTAEAIRHCRRKGVFVIAAAGNFADRDPNAQSWPAMMDECISVGATNVRRAASKFSETSSVDVAAPGEAILSCYLNGQYAVLSGTSMAAPWFSGFLAIELSEWILAGRSIPTFERVEEMIEAWTDDIDAPGDDPKTGNGLASVDRYLETKKKSGAIGDGTGGKQYNLGFCKVSVPARGGDWFSLGS